MKNLVNLVNDLDLTAGCTTMPKGHKATYKTKAHEGKKKNRGWATMKKYKFRRAAIKRGELGEVAQYGRLGHSSKFW